MIKSAKNGKSNNPKICKGNKEGVKFSSENQPSGKAKSLGHLKKKTIEETKKEIINVAFGQIYNKLMNGELTNQELINVFKSAIDMSGFKTSKQEVTQKEIKIEVANSDDKELLEGL